MRRGSFFKQVPYYFLVIVLRIFFYLFLEVNSSLVVLLDILNILSIRSRKPSVSRVFFHHKRLHVVEPWRAWLLYFWTNISHYFLWLLNILVFRCCVGSCCPCLVNRTTDILSGFSCSWDHIGNSSLDSRGLKFLLNTGACISYHISSFVESFKSFVN